MCYKNKEKNEHEQNSTGDRRQPRTGKDMALSLAQRGIDVVLTYHSKKEEAQAVVAEIEKAGQNAAALQFDACDIKSFDTFFTSFKTALKDTFGADHFDFLINNAGTALYSPFAETTEEQFDTALNIHYKGVFSSPKKRCRSSMTAGASSIFHRGLPVFLFPVLPLTAP